MIVIALVKNITEIKFSNRQWSTKEHKNKGHYTEILEKKSWCSGKKQKQKNKKHWMTGASRLCCYPGKKNPGSWFSIYRRSQTSLSLSSPTSWAYSIFLRKNLFQQNTCLTGTKTTFATRYDQNDKGLATET